MDMTIESIVCIDLVNLHEVQKSLTAIQSKGLQRNSVRVTLEILRTDFVKNVIVT